jgi:nitrous oxide reductase accessory protein NosL
MKRLVMLAVIAVFVLVGCRNEKGGEQSLPARFNINRVVSKNDSRCLPWLGCRRYAL